jgi:hypothetical protein
MRRDQVFVDATLSYFTQKQWIVHCCPSCARFVLLKENTMHPCPYCYSGIPDALSQAHSPFHHTTRTLHLEVVQRMERFYAEKEQIERVFPYRDRFWSGKTSHARFSLFLPCRYSRKPGQDTVALIEKYPCAGLDYNVKYTFCARWSLVKGQSHCCAGTRQHGTF